MRPRMNKREGQAALRIEGNNIQYAAVARTHRQTGNIDARVQRIQRRPRRMKRLHGETRRKELGRRPDARKPSSRRAGLPRRGGRMLKLKEKRSAGAIRVSLIGVCSGTRFWLAFEIRVIAPSVCRRTCGGWNRDIPVMAPE